MASLDVDRNPDLASQHRVRSCPRRRGQRYGVREPLAGALLEGSCERMVEALGVDFGQLADQHEVDEVLDPGALPLIVPKGAGIGVELLGNVLLERNGRQLQRCDVCELQRVRNDQQCRAILGLHRASAPIEVLRKSFEKIFAGVATALDGFILRANMASDHD